MTRRASYQHTTTIQVWPGGQSYTYRGDPEGDTNQRSLRGDARREGTRCFHCHAEIVQGTGDEIAGEWREVGRPHDYAHTRCPQNAPNGINGPHEPQSASFPEKWRKGTPAEWAAIVREVRAARIAEREVYCCDSGLVDDLLKNAGDSRIEPFDQFGYEEIRNLYADPSEWELDECRKYAEDYGIELPTTTRQTCCHHCQLDIEGDIFDEGWRDRGGNTHCRLEDEDETREQLHAQAEDESDTEQAEWLDAAREAIREHAQENPAEVFEWWRVSQWLCDTLHAIGEVTIDNGYGCWWGRCTTGQGFIMDGVLQRVADHLFAPADAAARAERLVVKP